VKIQQTTIELDKMIISFEKDNKISSVLAIPLKNILKQNYGAINVNLKSINVLTVGVKFTSPPSRISNVKIQSRYTKTVKIR
jgi:hypothetical protein